MTIKKDKKYLIALFAIVRYIAQDKPSAAKAFAKELDKHILNLLQFPYKYRQSHYYEDKYYRDLTYKGYTVIYKITEDAIQILDIFKWVEKIERLFGMTNKEKFDLICSCLDRAIQENSDRLPLETQRGTSINLVKRENGNYKIVFNTEKETYEAITKDNLYKFLFEGWRGNETLGREDGRITLFEAIHQYIQSHCDLIIPLEKWSLSKIIPLNQILYGPPGTGKTYNTITKALEIIDGSAPSERKEAKAKFEEYRKSGQIEFVTFHQSYGYEEFVEGIRAIPVGEEGNEDGEEMIYAVKDGIFKKMSKLSLENYTKNNHTVTPKRKFLLHAKTLNIQAEMVEEDSSTYRVLKGSKIRKGQAASFENYNYVSLKNKLLGDAKLKEETEFYILEEDYVFQSMSAASSVILGRQSNGYTDWKEVSDENNLFTQEQEKRNYILV
jgi:plasmid stabilization system protein ParE